MPTNFLSQILYSQTLYSQTLPKSYLVEYQVGTQLMLYLPGCFAPAHSSGKILFILQNSNQIALFLFGFFCPRSLWTETNAYFTGFTKQCIIKLPMVGPDSTLAHKLLFVLAHPLLRYSSKTLPTCHASYISSTPAYA